MSVRPNWFCTRCKCAVWGANVRCSVCGELRSEVGADKFPPGTSPVPPGTGRYLTQEEFEDLAVDNPGDAWSEYAALCDHAEDLEAQLASVSERASRSAAEGAQPNTTPGGRPGEGTPP